MSEPPRRLLLRLFQVALGAVDGRRVSRAALLTESLPPRIRVFAIGKAAAAMALGAQDALGDAIERAMVITRAGHAAGLLRDMPDAQIIEAAHPVPDVSSLLAGEALLAAVESVPPQSFPLFLISGGASSLVEVLSAGVTLADLQRCNEQGLAQGLDIEALNQRRCELSVSCQMIVDIATDACQQGFVELLSAFF